MILTIRTDKPEAEVGLFSIGGKKVEYRTWEAHRQLSETILGVISDILSKNNTTFDQLSGIIFYKGPGSFTGLRIGASVANALAVSLNILLVAELNDNWIENGARRISLGESEQALPYYGEEARTTSQKK